MARFAVPPPPTARQQQLFSAFGEDVPTDKKSEEGDVLPERRHTFNEHLWGGNSVPEVQLGQLHYLAMFYTPDMIRKLLLPLITGESKLSLNLLKNFMCIIADVFDVSYVLRSEDGVHEQVVLVKNVYKNAMARLSRNMFATVRRGSRVFVTIDGKTHTTTTGQLTGLQQAWQFGIITYIMCNFEEVEARRAEIRSNHQMMKREQVRSGQLERINLAPPRPKRFMVRHRDDAVCVITRPTVFDLCSFEGWADCSHRRAKIVSETVEEEVVTKAVDADVAGFTMTF